MGLGEWMSAHGFDEINGKYKNRDTPLIIASRAGDVEMVSLLLKYGADKELKTLDDYTALESASTATIVRLLKS